MAADFRPFGRCQPARHERLHPEPPGQLLTGADEIKTPRITLTFRTMAGVTRCRMAQECGQMVRHTVFTTVRRKEIQKVEVKDRCPGPPPSLDIIDESQGNP
jgi:hypothetical protein